MRKFKKIIGLVLLINLFFINSGIIQAVELSQTQKNLNYAKLYLNEDKYENFNRKIFNFNLRLNRIFVRKIHVLWASLFPEFLINSLNCAYSNIEYPKRLISSLLQRDFDAMRHETKRILINTTLGAAGLIDFAAKVFKLEMYNEDMEQALAKCKIKCGRFLVLPFVSCTNTRDIFGRILDFALNPTTYIASPIAAAIKMGLLINRTAYIQPIINMVESNFADPYIIAKEFFGVEKYIKLSNYDRKNVLEKIKTNDDEIDLVNKDKKENKTVKGAFLDKNSPNIVVNLNNEELRADIFLDDYNPQSPVMDSMRTALFDYHKNEKSFWHPISLWNRNFAKKIKTGYAQISKDKPKYKFYYMLQKEKTSPLVVILPSVGEGSSNSHGKILAELFYEEGYSAIILGSHFQWEFVKSIDDNYHVGLIKNDIKYINLLINNIISDLSKKYDRTFLKRTAIGTSLGAYTALFIANNQYETGGNNFDKFIAISPPYSLLYAIGQIDEITSAWKNYPDNLKDKVAYTVAKVIRAYNDKDEFLVNFEKLPFTNYEAKLISAFVFNQKLSDLIYQTEIKNNPDIDKKEIYKQINSMNYNDYIKKYFITDEIHYDDIAQTTSIKSINDYLINSDNYKIYHSLDDYLINKSDLRELKTSCDDKLVLLSNGAHLGFLYRKEFIDDLKKEIKIK